VDSHGGTGPGTEHNPSPTAADDVEEQLNQLLEESDLDLDPNGKLRIIVSSHDDDPPNLDIALSTHRDDLQGADDEDLSTLKTQLDQLLEESDVDLDANDHLQVDVQDLLSISDDPPNLDLAVTALRDDLRGTSDKTLTDVISDIRGGSSKTLSTLETDVEALLEQAHFNAVMGEVAAAPTSNTVLDRLRQIQETDFATEATLSGVATEQTLANQLDITLSALRDALRGADGDDLTVVHGELESLVTELEGKADQGEAQAIQDPPHADVDLSSRASESTLAKTVPEAKAALFDHAASANTDILTDEGTGALTPTDSPTHLRVFVALDTATVFSAMLDQGGSTQHELELNAGTQLDANALYRFTLPARNGDQVDFQVDDAAHVLRLTVDEVTAAL
jgi:frataxin-like iron-binding protein CyaY